MMKKRDHHCKAVDPLMSCFVQWSETGSWWSHLRSRLTAEPGDRRPSRRYESCVCLRDHLLIQNIIYKAVFMCVFACVCLFCVRLSGSCWSLVVSSKVCFDRFGFLKLAFRYFYKYLGWLQKILSSLVDVSRLSEIRVVRNNVLSQLISRSLKIRLIDVCVVKIINWARLSLKKNPPQMSLTKCQRLRCMKIRLLIDWLKMFQATVIFKQNGAEW